jgi:sialic acid synthase SpsE/CMP-N-acetylneuraminic acid synthetase
MFKNYTAIIPARKGSIRLKNKNTKLLNGKPLIEYSIDFAIQFNFNKIIITSNDEKVEKIVNKYKNTQIYFYKRQDILSKNTTSTIDVLDDVLTNLNIESDIVLLQPTSPFRNKQTLINMIKIFEEKNDTVTTISKHSHKRFGTFKDNLYTPINYTFGDRNQDIKDTYRENGNIYIFKKNIIKTKRLIKTNMYGYKIQGKEEIDIDTSEDFQQAENVLKTSINDIKINENVSIGLNKPAFIIAEACDNHMGRMDYAYKMVDVAVLCGADAIKFQHHLPDEEMLKNVPMSGNFKEPLYDILKKYSLTLEQHRKLKKYCDEKGILYMCTPFSAKAAKEINDLVPLFKIGSGECTDHPTLMEIAKLGKPMIISTGMSITNEIEETLNIIKPINNKLIILNCTSEYPPKYNDINVNLIPKLRDHFNIIVGHSDHTPDNFTCFAAVSVGAKVIEKHIILDKLIPGPDQNVSIDPMGLHELIDGIRKIEKALGDQKTVHELEKPIKLWARRSIVTIKNIKKGQELTLDNIWCKRPGTGIPSKYLYDFIGKKVNKDIEKDQLLKNEDVF